MAESGAPTLRVRNIFPGVPGLFRTPFIDASAYLADGHLDQLRSLFESRKLTPWDEEGDGNTLFAVSAAPINSLRPCFRKVPYD